MQQTSNYALKKIELIDSPPDITAINPNWDTIDAELKKLSNATADGATAEQLKVIENKIGTLTNLTTTEKTNLVAAINEIRLTIANHSVSESNPHKVTKSQVGLGNVGNFTIANQVEAEAGTSDVKYMTPLKVKQAVLKLSPKLEKVAEINFASSPTTLAYNIADLGSYEELVIVAKNVKFKNDWSGVLQMKLNNANYTFGISRNDGTYGTTNQPTLFSNTSGTLLNHLYLEVTNKFEVGVIFKGVSQWSPPNSNNGIGKLDFFVRDTTARVNILNLSIDNWNVPGEQIISGIFEVWGA